MIYVNMLQRGYCNMTIGGVVGSSIAYHLSALSRSLRVAVIERDPRYVHASAMLSVCPSECALNGHRIDTATTTRLVEFDNNFPYQKMCSCRCMELNFSRAPLSSK